MRNARRGKRIKQPDADTLAAQREADRMRVLRHKLASDDVWSVLALTSEQQAKFEDWSSARLASLAQQFDIDTTASQKRMSWGMRIASTIGAIAICAAIVLC